MLVVKTKLGISSKRGIGLFADQAIHAGDIISLNNENYSIIRYTEKQWDELKNNLSTESFKHIQQAAYKRKADGLYWLHVDDTGFINHSKDPNIETLGDTDVAIKDIKQGEEILIDYRTFYDPKYFQEIMELS